MKRLVFVVAVAACASKPEAQPSESMNFANFAVEIPPGWKPTEHQLAAATGGKALVPVVAATHGTPSIIVSELVMSQSDHKRVFEADALFCRDTVQTALAASTNMDAGPARAAGIGPFRGCDVVLRSKKMVTRQLSLSDRKLGVSIVCNRPVQPTPELDQACEALARTIAPR